MHQVHENAPHPFSRPFDPDSFERGLRDIARRAPFRFPSKDVPAHFKQSSVLLCFWREEADVRVLLTKRAASLRGHPGQMSFPGGRLEDGESFTQAALRETEEEVNLARDHVEVLGRLDDAWSGAGHLLVPIVGWLDQEPSLRASPDEVEAIHTPPLSGFFSQDAYRLESREHAGGQFFNPTLRWSDAEVYGLSADLLIEAVQYALGLSEPHGPGRLDNLRRFFSNPGTESTGTKEKDS